MKLRQVPEDFVVDEVSNFKPEPDGQNFVYELKKRSIPTLEALEMIARKAGIKARTLSAAGLKDKHAVTTQFFSAKGPLPAEIKLENIEVRFLGKAREPLTSSSITANSFAITMRGLSDAECERLPGLAAAAASYGVPNYYDNQRFGGIAHGQGFIGRALIHGQIEEALRLHLAAPHRKQSLRDKRNREMAAKHWGDWQKLRGMLKPSSERALVEYLVENPTAWGDCFERITPSLRGLFVAAYQSFLFNETVRHFLMDQDLELYSVLNKAGVIPMYRALNSGQVAAWHKREFPLLGPGTDLNDFPLAYKYAKQVLEDEEVLLERMSLSELPRTSFHAGTRALLLFPKGLTLGEFEPDDLNEGRMKSVARFELPRGSYATVIMRRLAINPERDMLVR